MNDPKTDPVSVGYRPLERGEIILETDERNPYGTRSGWVVNGDAFLGYPYDPEFHDPRRRRLTRATWFISCELPADKFTTEQAAIHEAKHRALEYGGKFTVFHAVRAFEATKPVPAQVREVPL